MTVAEILSKAGESESEALREHAIFLCMSKISRYEAESERFQKKYGESFDSFRKQIRSGDKKEDFIKEDDFLDWEYATTALSYWRDCLEELRSAG